MADARRFASEKAANRDAGLVLIDIDQVLAMYRGGDCQVGLPIYRTCKEIPEPLQGTIEHPIDLAVVTHRARGEADCILDAVGLTAWSRNLITANDLFWESIKIMARERRVEGLSKAVA